MNVIDLSSGQLVEPLPVPARKALAAAERVTAYAPAHGQADLRAAVAEHYRQRSGQPVSTADITIAAGGRHGLLAAVAATAAGGDVLVPQPHWSHYPKMLRLGGAEPVLVPGDPATGWLADPGLLERARTPRTKAVIINSPVNPTGAAYDEPTMRSIRDWAADHGVYLISDDIYWAYCANSGAVRASGHEVVVGGAAKVHALAGLRIGWIWSLPQVTEAVRDVVAHTTGPVSTLAQTAVAAVLRDAGHADAVSDRAERLAALRERAVAAFSTVPMMRPVIPVGGIYVCLDASALLARRQFGAADDRALCRVLEERAAVRLRAGSTFGLPGHLRLCVAVTPDVLEEAADRLATFVGAAEMDAAETDSVRNMGVP